MESMRVQRGIKLSSLYTERQVASECVAAFASNGAPLRVQNLRTIQWKCGERNAYMRPVVVVAVVHGRDPLHELHSNRVIVIGVGV